MILTRDQQRELFGAEALRFGSVAEALVWRAHAPRSGPAGAKAIPIVPSGNQTSPDERAQVEVTRSLLRACLQPRDPDGLDGVVLHHAHVLSEWHTSRRPQHVLARELGLTLHGLRRVMGWTEQVVFARMKARGLLEQGAQQERDEEDCG